MLALGPSCDRLHHWFMTKHLVFIGDSLTARFDWQQRFPDSRVTNLGISGEQVEELLGRRALIRSQLEFDAPDYLFLMSGINNLGMGHFEFSAPYRELVRNLATWYKRSTIVVQSILPVDAPGIDNRAVREQNRKLEAIAREFHVEYLDVYSAFVDANGRPRSEYFQDDGVHLSGRGYEAWSNVVEQFLKRKDARASAPGATGGS